MTFLLFLYLLRLFGFWLFFFFNELKYSHVTEVVLGSQLSYKAVVRQDFTLQNFTLLCTLEQFQRWVYNKALSSWKPRAAHLHYIFPSERVC